MKCSKTCCNPMIASAIMFALLAVVHVVRAAMQMPANVGEYNIPMWVSYATALIGVIMAYWNVKSACCRCKMCTKCCDKCTKQVGCTCCEKCCCSKENPASCKSC
jgi:hypothetical protein